MGDFERRSAEEKAREKERKMRERQDGWKAGEPRRITVTISGHKSAGRTTVAVIIDQALRKAGLLCHVRNEQERIEVLGHDNSLDAIATDMPMIAYIDIDTVQDD